MEQHHQIKINLLGGDGPTAGKWLSSYRNIRGEIFEALGDSPYEALELALESQEDYKAACQKQSATIRFFEFEEGALDVRFIFHPALTPETKPSVATKAISVCMEALRANAGDKRIIT
jgi:hypothetical protein